MCQLVLLLSPWVLPHNGVLPASELWDSTHFFPFEMTLLQQLKPDGDVASVVYASSGVHPRASHSCVVTMWPETRMVGPGFLS